MTTENKTTQTPRRNYTLRRVLMKCDRCGHTELRSCRGGCKMCGDGIMQHHELLSLRVYAEAQPAPEVAE